MREKVYQNDVDKGKRNDIVEFEASNRIKVKKFSKHMEERASENKYPPAMPGDIYYTQKQKGIDVN